MKIYVPLSPFAAPDKILPIVGLAAKGLAPSGALS